MKKVSRPLSGLGRPRERGVTLVALDRPEQSLSPVDRPAGITAFELAELLDVIEELLRFSRHYTMDERPGEVEAAQRARRVLERMRDAP